MTLCLVSQSCPTVCNPMDCGPPGSSVHGILQARILERVGVPFSRGSAQPRDWTQVSHLTTSATWEAPYWVRVCPKSNDWYPLQKMEGKIKIQTQRNIRRRQCESGGRHWGEAASSWGMNAKAGQRSSRVRGDFRGSMALLTPWPQTSSLQNCGRINFYCFKPAVVWYFVFTALGTNILSKGNNWKNRIIIQMSPMTGYGPVAVLLFLTPEQNLCFWCMRACRVSQSCPTLCSPKNCSPPGSSVHGMSKARILEWVAMPSSRGSSQSRDRTHISCIGRWVLYPWATMKCSWYPLSVLQQNTISLLTKLY